MKLVLTGLCRREGPFLAEWLAYHRLIGFDHVFLGCNDAPDSDDYHESLRNVKPYIDQGVLTWYDRPDKPGPRGAGSPKLQHEFYDYVINQAKKQHDWMLISDVDEYLVADNRQDLKSLLTQYELQEDLAGIRCYWRLFGSSGLQSVEGLLQTESLVHHIPADVPVAKHAKTIFRLDRVGSMLTPHEPRPKPGFQLTKSTARTEERWKPLCINHYFCRGPKDFERKLSFGRPQGMDQMTVATRWEMWHMYNDAATQRDDSMANWADDIRNAIRSV